MGFPWHFGEENKAFTTILGEPSSRNQWKRFSLQLFHRGVFGYPKCVCWVFEDKIRWVCKIWLLLIDLFFDVLPKTNPLPLGFKKWREPSSFSCFRECRKTLCGKLLTLCYGCWLRVENTNKFPKQHYQCITHLFTSAIHCFISFHTHQRRTLPKYIYLFGKTEVQMPEAVSHKTYHRLQPHKWSWCLLLSCTQWHIAPGLLVDK